MPGVFMDTKLPAESFASFSGDESQSSSDWGKDGFSPGRPKTCKRREKNRDAARKSRKKQTERADLLHEELQFLERSNATFEREIADLKAELKRYTTALQQHEPHCSLFDPSRITGNGPQQAKTAFSSTSTTSSVPALNVSSPPVASAPSLSVQPGEAFSELSLSELLESTDWIPPWQPGHWSVL